jgi:hypothetical protein
MKKAKRTETLYVRVSPEFKELLEMIKTAKYLSVQKSDSDILTLALSHFVFSRMPFDEKMNALAQLLSDVDNSSPRRRRRKSISIC